MKLAGIAALFMGGVFWGLFPCRAGAVYETVNASPQLEISDQNFSFYWALWRTLASDERKVLLQNQGGNLIGLREISWRTHDCASKAQIFDDQERLWTWDPIRFDSQGKLIPIPEAYRQDFLYFVMGNINSQYFKGLGAFIPPQRYSDEDFDEYQIRKKTSFVEWQEKSSTRGTAGSLWIRAEHRLFSGFRPEKNGFYNLWDYVMGPFSQDPAFDAYRLLSPDRWPVYFDERAHKQHTLSEPAIWQQTNQAVSVRHFGLRLEWEWCSGIPQIRAFVPVGGMPPGGPTRNGRTDRGHDELNIVERVDWDQE